MTRFAAITALVLALSPLAQADPTRAAVEALQAKVTTFQQAPPGPEKDAALEQVYQACGGVLDEHLAGLTRRELTWIGSLWFQLAARRGDAEALAARAASLRAQADLPPHLEAAIERNTARLRVQPGAIVAAWNAVDVTTDRYAPVFAGEGLTLVQFWSSWCPPCRRLMAERLRALAQRHGERVSLVSVGLPGRGESAEREAAFAAKQGYGWRFLYDEGGDCAEDLGVQAHPYLLLVDAERRVLLCGPGWAVIDQLEELLEARQREEEALASRE